MKSTIAAALALALAVTFSTAAAQEPAPTRSVWSGVYSEEQATRGNALYAQHCSSCHGDELLGHEIAPALTGGAFAANWDGLTLGDLSERIRLSMPADSPGRLGRQQVADLLAFILSVGQFPAGRAELPREAELLKQITIVARKP